VIFGPLMRGSELGWTEMAGPKSSPFGTQLLAYLVFKQGPNWDPMTLKFDSETLARVDAPEIQPMNAWDPDISKFIARGGKLLLMGGWGDASIDPGLNVDYYEHVMQVVGEKARDSVRLFMVPGMGHAPGRNGPNAYDTDLMAAIKQWKATNKAPDDLIFTHWVNGVATNKALVCAYPEVVTYKGSGDTIDPESFTCKPGAHVGWEPKAAEKRK
jgi:feruloyl esterase